MLEIARFLGVAAGMLYGLTRSLLFNRVTLGMLLGAAAVLIILSRW